ncbi:MAG: LamG-like jellyroll fold domain-containing protein [Candidatus Nitrotoga sp.]
MIKKFFRQLAFATLSVMAAGVSATPITTTGLELWLDASAISTGTTAVSTWADQSGHGRDATATGATSTPTYIASNSLFSNRPTVSFDGGDFLNSALASVMNITGNSARTIFFVFSQDSAASRNIFGYGASSSLALFDVAAAGQEISGHFHGTPFVNGSQTFALNQMTVGAVRYNGTAFQTYQHDTSFNGQTASTAYSLNTSDSAFNIGRGAYSGYNSFNGDIAELLVYSRALSDSELSAVDSYLNTKYTTTAATITVPEPASLLLVCIGLVGLGVVRQKRIHI